MFRKKRSPKSETRTINVAGIPVKATIDEEGNITADYSIRVNGQKYDFADKTTIAEITQISQNEDNPNSCEKEPNSSEVKIPVAGFFEEYQLGLVGSEIGDRVWAASMRAKRNGYNYFTVNREDFEYVQNKAKKQ